MPDEPIYSDPAPGANDAAVYGQVHATWKKNQTPEGNAAALSSLQPLIERTARAHVGMTNPLLLSHARRMTLAALRSYDPAKAQFPTHLFNQLQGLKRVQRQQAQGIRVPERIVLDRQHLDTAATELEDQLGRPPSDGELADFTGLSLKRMARVRQYQPPVAEGALSSARVAPEDLGQVGPAQRNADAWLELVYADLSPMDQRIMEHTLGLHGRRPLSNAALAAKLGRSQGLISQRKRFIQQMLDKEHELSPFR